MRYYYNETPKVDDIVMCNVEKIQEYCIYVKLIEYNNIEDPNGPEAEEIIQNLNLKVTQGLIQDAANADNVNVEDVRIIND